MRTGQELVTAVDRKRGPDERCFGTKLILSGAHDPKWRNALARIEAPMVALSFSHFFKRAADPSKVDELVRDLVEQFSGFRFVFLESGGRMYQKGTPAKFPEAEVYRAVYHDFLRQFQDTGLWTVAAEFDVWDSDQHRAEGLLELAETGVEIVPVIHDLDKSGPVPIELTPEGMLNTWPMVSVAGALVKSNDHAVKTQISELHATAKEAGSLLHAYGVSRNSMAKGSWFCATSGTWLTGSRFGRTTVWDEGSNELRYLTLAKKADRATLRSRFEDSGLDWAKIEEQDPEEINLSCAVGWIDWGKHLSAQVDNAYWLTDPEKEVARPDRVETVSPEVNDAAMARIEQNALATAEDGSALVIDKRTLQPLLCNTCVVREKCPLAKADASCSFQTISPVTGDDSATAALNAAITIQLDRVQRGALMEKVTGGALHDAVGEELERLANMVLARSKSGSSSQESLTLTGGPGIMESFVKAIQGPPPKEAKVIDTTESGDVIDV